MSAVAPLALPRRRLWRPTASLLAAGVLAGTVLVALVAGALAPYPPRAIVGAPIEAPSGAHRLGTNDLGQDLLSLLLHGARRSLAVGFLAASCSTLLSAAVGTLSVLWRPARLPLLAATEGLMAIPNLPVIVLIVSLLGPGPTQLVAALAVLSWPAFARVVRTQVAGAIQRDYVEAARALGATEMRVFRACVLPEILPVLWTKFLLTLRWAIVMEAVLALMGLGDPTQPSWGMILQTAFAYPLLFVGTAWAWWALPPALAIAAVTLALAIIGQDFEAWLNPGLRQRAV
ncbi:MAG: ABC transporter permease [Armatimonadota bacterium]|nr:ABC transporter permease [Armatimonadota bacterium]MDR7486735.1 ABC transporter permease [Armatimonadota bacterium]MDR7534285.1 ABC transporter permease [Armatimonadota bacterium]MDR7535364.1 ABC transporter permease [Armatimonadota bacterium]